MPEKLYTRRTLLRMTAIAVAASHELNNHSLSRPVPPSKPTRAHYQRIADNITDPLRRAANIQLIDPTNPTEYAFGGLILNSQLGLAIQTVDHVINNLRTINVEVPGIKDSPWSLSTVEKIPVSPSEHPSDSLVLLPLTSNPELLEAINQQIAEHEIQPLQAYTGDIKSAMKEYRLTFPMPDSDQLAKLFSPQYNPKDWTVEFGQISSHICRSFSGLPILLQKIPGGTLTNLTPGVVRSVKGAFMRRLMGFQCTSAKLQISTYNLN
jgi:hypothetical protein